jgi:hypothetical protein
MLNSKAEYLAKKYLLNAPQDQQMGALQRALSEMPPNVPNSLQQLITAHNLLKKSQEQQQRQQALALAQQGQVAPSGGFARSVKDDVAQALAAENQQLEAQLMAREAAPMRAGGIAELPVQNFSENSFAGGGIVAFAEGGDPEERYRTLAERQQVSTPALARWWRNAPWQTREQSIEQNARELARAQTLVPGAAAAPQDQERTPPVDRDEKGVRVGDNSGIASLVTAKPATSVDAGMGGSSSAAPRSLLFPEMQEMQRIAMGKIKDTKALPEKTLDEIRKEQEEGTTAALRKAGLSEKPNEERIAEMKDEAQQALKDRDTDRLLALAQGFFAMGASKSPRLLESMSEGFGVTTKELKSVESEFRKAEKARKDAESALKQAQRAEVLGNEKRATESYERYQALQERSRAHDATIASTLFQRIGTAELAAAGREQANATRAAAAANTAAMREAALGEQQMRREQQLQIQYGKQLKEHPAYDQAVALQGRLVQLQQQRAAAESDFFSGKRTALDRDIAAARDQYKTLWGQIQRETAANLGMAPGGGSAGGSSQWGQAQVVGG